MKTKLLWLLTGIRLVFSFILIIPWFLIGYIAGLTIIGLRAGLDTAYKLVQ